MHRTSLLPMAGAVVAALSLVACADVPSTAPSLTAPELVALTSSAGGNPAADVAIVRQLAAARGVIALPAPPRVRPQLVRLGQALTFDPILSGNKDIS